MENQTAGTILLSVTIISTILLYVYIYKKKVYRKDLLGLLFDSWEIISVAIVLILVSLVLILGLREIKPHSATGLSVLEGKAYSSTGS